MFFKLFYAVLYDFIRFSCDFIRVLTLYYGFYMIYISIIIIIFILIIIIIIVIISINITIIILEVGPRFFRMSRLFSILTLFRIIHVWPEIPTTTEFSECPVFFNFNVFRIICIFSENPTTTDFFKCPVFLTINVLQIV